jgi:hypothetical protein
VLLGSDGIAVDGGRMAAKGSVGCVKSVAARVLYVRLDGGQRCYLSKTLPRTMTVGLFGTELQPHALSHCRHSLSSDAQAVRARLFTTFAYMR